LTAGKGLLNDTMAGNVVVSSGAHCLRVAGRSNTFLSGNRYYAGQASPFGTDSGDRAYLQYRASGITSDDGTSTVSPLAEAASSEGWPDPDRSVKSYMESLGYTVHTTDGVREFMDECDKQRKGYWRPEFTALAVVNYVREGFGKSPITALAPVRSAIAKNALPGLWMQAVPHAGGATVCYRADPGVRIAVTVYDLKGRTVKRLGERMGTGVASTISWDGTDGSGAWPARAACVVVLTAGNTVRLARTLLPLR
jgi:hypothetical protein